MERKVFLLFTCILISNCILSQGNYYTKTRQDSIELVEKLIRDNKLVTSRTIGFNGEPSKQFYRFLFLLNELDNSDFLNLLNDSSACLRFYAYISLLHNRYEGIQEIEASIKKDSSQIPVYFAERKGNYSAKEIIEQFNGWYERKWLNSCLAEYSAQKEFWYQNYILAK